MSDLYSSMNPLSSSTSVSDFSTEKQSSETKKGEFEKREVAANPPQVLGKGIRGKELQPQLLETMKNQGSQFAENVSKPTVPPKLNKLAKESIKRNAEIRNIEQRALPQSPAGQSMKREGVGENLAFKRAGRSSAKRGEASRTPLNKRHLQLGSSRATLSADSKIVDLSRRQSIGKADHDLPDPELQPEEFLSKLNESAVRPTEIRSTDQSGKEIDHIWSDNKGNAAKESIGRLDTADTLKMATEKEINYLQSKLDGDDPEVDREWASNRMQFLEKSLSRSSGVEKKWANSDFFRDKLRGNKNLNSSANSHGLKGSIEEYEKIMDDYYSFAPPVNMRNHRCSVLNSNGAAVDNSKGWVRVGIMSDMSNGFVNIESLNELKSCMDEGNIDEANDLRNEMIKDIAESWKASKMGGSTLEKIKAKFGQGNKNVDASAGYALKQIGLEMGAIEAISAAIKSNKGIESFEINMENREQVSQVISTTVEKRKELLSSQFLQLVMEQLNNSSNEELSGGELKMAHVALLNPHSKAIDSSGWNHDEENEMLDMAGVFALFDKSEIICDKNGPFIDEGGKIHLPPTEHFNSDITLRALFINQSVQGYTKNEGTPKKLNENARGQLGEMPPEQKEKVDAILDSSESGYSSAADIGYSLISSGYKLSTGCLSAKDRTGFVSALLSDRVMQESKVPESSRRKFLRKQLEEDSPAVKVIKDNTGTAAMKISPLIIEGVSDRATDLKGLATRVKIYAVQVLEILKEQQRIKNAERSK